MLLCFPRRLRLSRYLRQFLPLDEAVFVIVSESDGRTGERKLFWSQLSNSNMVRDRPYALMGSLEDPLGELSNGPTRDFYVPLNPQNQGVEKSPFETAVKS